MKKFMPMYWTLTGPLFFLYFSNSISASPQVTDADWISAGQGKGVELGYIKSMAVDKSGNLIAAGDFKNAGGLTTGLSIAKWDGYVWSTPWNAKINNDGDTNFYESDYGFLCIGNDGTLFLGDRDHVYSSAGSAIHSITGDMRVSVALMVFHDDMLYVAGSFSTEDGYPDIMQWDGTLWRPLVGGVITESNSQVNVLSVDSSGSLYAGGKFPYTGDTPGINIAKWNGTAWLPLGSGVPFTVQSIATDCRGNLYAGGYDDENVFISKWNGTSWESIKTAITGKIEAMVCDTVGNLYIGGDFTGIGTVAIHGCAMWNGTAWQPLTESIEFIGPIYALAIGNNGILYATGYYILVDGYLTGNIAQWNGAKWSPLGSGNGFCTNINELTIDADGTIFAGRNDYAMIYLATILRKGPGGWVGCSGYDYVYSLLPDNNGGLYAAVEENHSVVHWDGSQWSDMGLDASYTFRSMTMDNAGNLYAGGYHEFDRSPYTIAWWNGTTWNWLSGELNGIVNVLITDNEGNVYAGGEFTSAGVIPAGHIAKWDGVSWSPLGAGIAGSCSPCNVRALAFDKNGNLFAGGTFDSAGGHPAASVAKWDGAAWSPLGYGLKRTAIASSGTVSTLLFDSTGNLYAGGGFDSAGSVSARNVAHWDGTEWSALGSGCNGGVSAMVLDKEGVLHVGGSFDSAGGDCSAHYAMCKVGSPAIHEAVVAPQPKARMNGNGMMRIVLYTATDVVVRTFTLAGREVYRSQKTMGAGEHLIRMRTDGIGRGVYIVRIKYGGRSFVQKLIVKR